MTQSLSPAAQKSLKKLVDQTKVVERSAAQTSKLIEAADKTMLDLDKQAKG